jgi:murein DD-endopeptidase MepM/ murein hydrolase activator NlpD
MRKTESPSISPAEHLAAWLAKQTFFPILGAAYTQEDFCEIDLGPDLPPHLQSRLTTFEGLSEYVDRVKTEAAALIAYGGYGEKRVLYQTSTHFGSERSIHLGLDLWAPAGTPLYCPLEGRVHSFAYNDRPLDYGAALILEHAYPGGIFYSLYGHLSLSSIESCKAGQQIPAGSLLAWIGAPHENGGWVPHLHFQIIRELGEWEGDYPGVATAEEAGVYLKNCPDPNLLFQKQL